MIEGREEVQEVTIATEQCYCCLVVGCSKEALCRWVRGSCRMGKRMSVSNVSLVREVCFSASWHLLVFPANYQEDMLAPGCPEPSTET